MAAAEVLAAGGDRAIVVNDDLPERLQDALGGNELALVLDSVGGPAIAELAHHLRYGGKVVTYGALGGQHTEIEVRRDLIYRDLSHHGFWMNNWLHRARDRDRTRAVGQRAARAERAGVVPAKRVSQAAPPPGAAQKDKCGGA